ncbi:SRPBCC family protein [Deinococcus psychrotolerans]|nr:SRPBCC family protein [Deinococcus psychrotolerans]
MTNIQKSGFQEAARKAFFQGGNGGQMQDTERVAVGALGLGLLILGLGGGAGRRLLVGGLGLGLTAVAVRGSNPLATAIKVEQNNAGQTLISEAVTVNKNAAELYDVWRDLDKLPNLMSHLQSVVVLSEKRSRWTVKAPLGSVSWEAEITADEPGKRLAWASLPGSSIDNSGEILFRPAPGGRGSEVVVRLKYRAPLGTAGVVAARIAGQEPAQQLRDDLMRFKREQELGFAPTTQGQSSGRAGGAK